MRGRALVQNLTHTYTLTPAETAYLAASAWTPAAAGRHERQADISAPPSSRNYVEHYAEFGGTIKSPVLALHTEIDRLVPVSHVSAYAETIEAAGRTDLLSQAYTTGVGHCAFSTTPRPSRRRAGRVGRERRRADHRRFPRKRRASTRASSRRPGCSRSKVNRIGPASAGPRPNLTL